MNKMQRTLTFLFIFLAGMSIAQTPQLTFQFANPRTYNVGGADYFEYDLQAKSSMDVYIWSGTSRFTFNNTTFSQNNADWVYTKGELLAGTNTQSNPKYSITKSITGTAPNKVLTIGWSGDINVNGNEPNGDDFNLVTSTFKTVLTIRGKISSGSGLAGITMVQLSMNPPNQKYHSAANTNTNFANPNFYNPKDFNTTYVGRLFSAAWGWSQIANPVNGQFVDWTTAVNTSVWEGAPVLAGSASPYMFSALRIHAGASLTVSPGANVTTGGDLDIADAETLKILSDATGIGSLITLGTVTGTANIQQYNAGSYYTGNWHLISIPVDQVDSYTTFLHFYMKRYIENTGLYEDVQSNPGPGGTQLLNTPMEGFSTSFSGWNPDTTLTIIGNPNTGSKSIGYTNNNLGWNLLGNPYSSSVDWDLVTKPGTMDGAFWVWDGAAKNYKFYNLSGYPATATKYIPPAQGFFIKANAAGTLSFDNSVRAHSSQLFYKDDPQYSNCLKLETSGNSYSDVAFIMFNSEATSGFDGQIDVAKLMGYPEVPSIYSYSGNDTYALNVLASTDETPKVEMVFKTGQSGTYNIDASGMESFNSNTPILLEDLVANQVIDLRQNPEYSFAYNTNDPVHRFNIHFKNTFGIEDILNGVNIFGGDKEIIVKFAKNNSGTITVTDILGRIISSKTVDGLENVIPVTGGSQYYIVKVSGSSKVITEKVFVR